MLSKFKIKEIDLVKSKEELKSMFINEGIAWGSGLDQNNHAYKWTMDTKALLLNSRGLFLTTQLFIDKIKKYFPDAVGGLTLASHLIASSLVHSNDKLDGFLVRRERKSYNMAKLIEGPNIENKNVVIVDDGLNAAGFAKQAIDAVENIGCKVLAVIVLIDFEKEDHILLKKKGYKLESIFTLKEFGLDLRVPPSDIEMYQLKWRYGNVNVSDYGAPKSSPAVEDNRIYVGSDQGKMLCIDFSGKLVWEFKTEPHSKGVHQTPLIVDNKVIFAGYCGNVYALNKENGSLIWRNKLSSYNGATAIYDKETNRIYIGLENNTLKGTMAVLDADDGKLAWEFSTGNHLPCRGSIEKDLIVFGSNDSFIYACNKLDGKLIWKFRVHGEVKGRTTIDDGLCYATSFDGNIYCVDLFTGKIVWKKKLGVKLLNAPLIYKDKVVVGSFSNQLTALNKKTGNVFWYFMTSGDILSYPVCSGGVVYVGSNDSKIYAVDAENGNLLWNFITGGKVSSSPTIYKDRLFVSSNDGYLYCFEKN